jgi:tryptophanyl-tRNA synthetase
MSLTEPESKMSKSDPSERSRILVTDSADDIRRKVSAALTDSLAGITYDVENRPGFSNLLQILAVFDPQGRDPTQLADAYGDIGPKRFKEVVSNAVVDGLAGIRERYQNILNNRQVFLDDVEMEGSIKARKNAEETMELVRDAVGL